MKELSIEEKAKAYDEALKKAKDMLSYKEVRREDMEYLFLELKESEDERIREEIITYLSTVDDKELIPYESWIAWLKKQAEHTNFRNAIQIGDKVTRNKDGVLVNLSQLNRVAKKDEKQGEQKLVEFIQERDLKKKLYQLVYACAWDKVTCKVEGETQEEYAERWAEQFLLMVRDWADDYIDFTIQQKLRKSYDKGKENAIKENRTSWSEEDEKIRKCLLSHFSRYREDEVFLNDILMKDIVSWLEKRGEKDKFIEKELQCIKCYRENAIKRLEELEKQGEKKPTDKVEPKFKVGDVVTNKKSKDTVKIVQILHDSYCYSGWDGAATVHSDFSISEQDDWELVKQKPAWSEEDESTINEVIMNYESAYLPPVDKRYNIINRLKSLKDRVQPKQEWSEEDNQMIKNVQNDYHNRLGAGIIPQAYHDKVILWLKSLRPQNTWKPSEEQLMYLCKAIDIAEKSEEFSVMSELKDLLKQLIAL